MLREEQRVSVLLREHLARVETHPQRGHVRTEGERRRLVAGARLAVTERGIEEFPGVAIGETEVQPRLVCAIELVARNVVPQLVTPVLREPQGLGLWVPVETDRVAHTL